MESLMRSTLGRVLYGAIFVAALPLALIAWARAVTVSLPEIHSVSGGLLLTLLGTLAMAAGMISLWRDGGGLPMNAFPPPRFVQKNIYALVPHPIYGGFVLICCGVSVAFGSASGLWLVTPSVALACAALVLGHEMPDLQKRFGVRDVSLWLPRDRAGSPSMMERVRVYLVVLLPWLAIFELIGAMGKVPNAWSTYLPFEKQIPVCEQTELLYASTYLVVLLAPLLVGSGRALRRFAELGLRAMALLFPLYLLLPFFVPPRSFHALTPIGSLLLLERTPASGIAAFPSFQVVWALIAATALGEGGPWRKALWRCWAGLVAISCVTTGMHSILDVLAGAIAFLVVIRMDALWAGMLKGAEIVANAWKEWRIGPVRIINHGGFAAMATLVGLSMIDVLLGPGHTAVTASIFFFSITGAALWAQWVEGSPALLRPLGFYGGMLGAILGGLTALVLGVSLWTVLAAVCIAAPWIQGIGRLRCLVQGCCHGCASTTVKGIRYTHPRTRVCRLTEFAGAPIHATQVYSIACNVVIGAALLRLYQLRVSGATICGVYLLLSGAGRFVEEAYRGEPQTKSFFGLHFYQWIAVACVVAGAAITTAPSSALPELNAIRPGTVVLVIVCSAISWFVTGVDFPDSSRRFARLT
ncbi:MAG: prolipoprotein diacylglyceryl transferase [Terracidiphilus sp.]|nr:prolipoprotein diacylglyceryl transferase [Terracidiphilus sp.]